MDGNKVESVNCPSCGTINKGDNINCQKCGYQLKTEINGYLNSREKNKKELNVKLQEKDVQKNIINCPKCGNKNSSSYRFCSNCGAILKNDEQTKKIIEQTNAVQEQNTTEKTESSLLYVGLGIASLMFSGLIPYGFIIVLVLAVASLFNEKTKAYGKTVFIGIAVLFVTFVVLFFIAWGMCLASVGAL